MDAPAVAVSGDGKRLAVAWMDYRNGRTDRDVWWVTTQGGRLTAESAPGTDTGGLQSHPALCVDERGAVHAAWEDGRGTPTTIYYRASDAKEDVAVGTGGGRCGYPSIACGKPGVVIAYETHDKRVMCRVLSR
jgi:hypothetical protein